MATEATTGHIWLDAGLLDAGMFSWGTVQHEYAHEVDFFLLDSAKRRLLQTLIGGEGWGYGGSRLAPSGPGREALASPPARAQPPAPFHTRKPAPSQGQA